ncbi:MAG: hypothetical protein ACYTGC_11425 [Planctomycetota bacterium]
MAASDNRPLDAGTAFPTMTLKALGDAPITIPADLAGRWAVLLAYRGHW